MEEKCRVSGPALASDQHLYFNEFSQEMPSRKGETLRSKSSTFYGQPQPYLSDSLKFLERGIFSHTYSLSEYQDIALGATNIRGHN